MAIKIELKQISCSYLLAQKVQNGFLEFLVLFLRSKLLMNRKNY